MSVESEILRIQHNVANAYAAVSGKGGEVPLQPTSAKLAAAVMSIPQTLPPPDNNPIGTVISYMGLAAPKDYLICDGAEYSIADYPALAAHFSAQFGAANHFGGDGETTFAVPDMRNLFLRGYHGEAEEQLSREIGMKQEGTVFPDYGINGNDFVMAGGTIRVSEYDTRKNYNSGCRYINLSQSGILTISDSFTSRPVNMAVLYCIKATESYPAENVYSTEETRIGTWIDGKPIYRKVFLIDSMILPGRAAGSIVHGLPVDSVIDIRGTASDPVPSNNYGRVPINSYFFCSTCNSSHFLIYNNYSGNQITISDLNIIVEYTKTTDFPTVASASSLQMENTPLAIKTPESFAQVIASTAATMT